MVNEPEILVQIRRAVPYDAAGVARLRRALREAEAASVRGPDEPALTLSEEIARITAQDREAGKLTLVAELGEEVVGWLELTSGEPQRTAHRGWVVLAVAEEHRRRGIGRALLQHLHGWAARHPVVEQVVLRCAASNAPALALYRGLGYEEEGRFRRGLKLGPDRYVDVVQLCLDVRATTGR